MEQVVKVSISNVAFTLEQDAHQRLEAYLLSLNSHYSGSSNSQEIVFAIEERISEILIEKGYKEAVIPIVVIEEIIAQLGSADQIDSEGSTSGKKIKKRLFRDGENKILGGVCSGLGLYFGIDPVVFRLFFSILTLLFLFVFTSEFFLVILLTYLLLWIVVPMAKTTAQKCAMRGEENTLDSIKERVESGANNFVSEVNTLAKNQNFWNRVGRVLRVTVGLVFLMTGIVGVLVLLFVALSGAIWSNPIPFSLAEILSLASGSPKWASVALCVTMVCSIVIPFLWVLYSGILLLSGQKRPRWRPGLIMFVLWVMSFILAIPLTVNAVVAMDDAEVVRNESIIELQNNGYLYDKDTLYVEFVGLDKYKNDNVVIDASRYGYELLYLAKDASPRRVTLYPQVYVYQNESAVGNSVELEASTHILKGAISLKDLESVRKTSFCEVKGNTLYLYPQEITSESVLGDFDRKIHMETSPQVTVVIKEPVYHDFKSNFEFTDLRQKFILELID